MNLALAYIVAIAMLPLAFVLHVLLRALELWHFGPSQWLLRGLRWLNYKAFKPVSTWVLKQRNAAQQPAQGEKE